jgi:hypothetical protein
MVEVEDAFNVMRSNSIISPQPRQGDCSKDSIMTDTINKIGDTIIIKMASKHKHNVSIKTKNQIGSTFTKRLDLDHLNQLLENWQFRQSILPDFGFDHTQPSSSPDN